MKSRLIIAVFVIGCQLAGCSLEEGLFETDVRRKSYPMTLDTDKDGLTDREELASGMDPDDGDANKNGISDGDDDTDGDGMTNAWEILMGFDPNNPDSSNTKLGSATAGNGISDCDEDTDGDGLPNCWEIANKLDPLDPSDGQLDSDNDGFTNFTEYPQYDPNDPESHPPKEKDLVLFDDNLNIEGRTNALSVRGTARFCFGGDKLLLTTSTETPAKTDPGFVACTLVNLALSGTLATAEEISHTMYMWRLGPTGTLYPAVNASVVLDTTGPAGGALTTTSQSYYSVSLSHSLPTDADYTTVKLRRYAGTGCANSLVTEGVEVAIEKTTTSISDTNLALDTSYCYKIFWYDDLENFTYTTVETKTLDAPACNITGHNVWYPGADVAYQITCDDTVNTVVETSKPADVSYLSLVTALPATGAMTFGGMPATSHGSTPWTLRMNDAVNVNGVTEILATTPSFTISGSEDVLDDTEVTVAVSANLDLNYDGTAVEFKILAGDAVTPATTSNGPVSTAETDIPGLTYTDSAACAGGVSPFVCSTNSVYTTGTNIATADLKIRWNYGAFDQGTYYLDVKGFINADNAKLYDAETMILLWTEDLGAEKTPLVSGSLGTSEFFGATFSDFTPALAIQENSSSSSGKQVFGLVYPASVGQRNQFAGIAHIDRSISNVNFSDSWFPNDNDSILSANVNAESMAIASSINDTWVALGGHPSAAGIDLVLSQIEDDSNGGLAGNQRLITKTNLTTLPGGNTSRFKSVAVSSVFNDSGTNRHGIAFFAYDFGSGTKKLFVSKINPAGTDENSLLDAGAYYDGGSNIDSLVKAVPITVDLTFDIYQVRISHAVVSAANYFYVGWSPEDFTGNLHFARTEASSAGIPATIPTKAGDEIGSFDVSNTARGRPFYGLTAGKDSDGNDLMAVFYTKDAGAVGDTKCYFQAYKANAGGTQLERFGSTKAISSDNCIYPHIFFNGTTFRFIVAYADSVTDQTIVSEFQYNSVTDQFSPLTPKLVVATTHSADVCQFSAGYSPVSYQLGMVSIDGPCNVSSHTMVFDTYKSRIK